MDINKEWYDGQRGREGTHRLFFRKCNMCGQHKVLFTQKCLGESSSPPEGCRTHWATPKLILGTSSKEGYLCDSCGHFKERFTELKKLEKQIELAEKKLNELRRFLVE